MSQEEEDYLGLVQQFLSLDYREKPLKIMANPGLHIFDRLLFLRRFCSKQFPKTLSKFLEDSREQRSLEALIFFFRDGSLVRDILQSLLGKANQTRTSRGIWNWWG